MPTHTIHRIALVALLVALPAMLSAATVRWQLRGVTFADGATASGYFDFDPATETYGNFSMTTTDGTSITGRHYDNITASPRRFFFTTNPSQLPTYYFTSMDTPWALRLTPATELDDSGGLHDLDLSYSNGNQECRNCNPSRLITAGQLEGIVDIIFADGFDGQT